MENRKWLAMMSFSSLGTWYKGGDILFFASINNPILILSLINSNKGENPEVCLFIFYYYI